MPFTKLIGSFYTKADKKIKVFRGCNAMGDTNECDFCQHSSKHALLPVSLPVRPSDGMASPRGQLREQGGLTVLGYYSTAKFISFHFIKFISPPHFPLTSSR